MNMEESKDISLKESIEDGNNFLDMELEALKSIYINEIEVNKDDKYTTVSIDLYPATADKLDEQYVRMTLQFNLKEEYPEVIPDIKIRNPRGLSEEKLSCIDKDLLTIAETKRGNSMLFEMIDAAKEHLTVGNRPSGECAICLYGFSDNDVFTKTECYHYFHSHCLARYAKNFNENAEDNENDPKSSNELLCPMCRIPIQFNGADDDFPPPEESDDSDFVLTEEIRELQVKMADLYQKQMEKGGIIDVEAEKNKFLLEISNVPTQIPSQIPSCTSTDEKLEQKIVTDEDSCATDSQVEPSDDSPSKERKERVRERHERFDYKRGNRDFNKPSENKGNYKPDRRYNRHSYDNYQRNYSKNRYGRHNHTGSQKQFNDSDLPRDTNDSTEPCELSESDDQDKTKDVHDDLSETSEQASIDSKGNRNTDFSPRYNRGHRGGNRYGYNNRRFNKSNYHERTNSQTSRRYGTNHGGEQSSANSEERFERDARGVRNYDNDHKPNYRSGSFRYDENYKQRYPDSRNSQRGYKGAYGRRDNYSYNNYPRGNRYGDFRDRDQYHGERDKNFRMKKSYKEGRYQGGGDNVSEGYNKQGARNYTRNRAGSYPDRSYTESSNNESESVELSSHSDSKNLMIEKECNPEKHADSSEMENKSSQKLENCSANLSNNSVPVPEGNRLSGFPSVSNNIASISSRTVNPPPGFANPLKKVIYGLPGANPPPGFNKS